ncbi:unnamed protein product [Schistosoma curassoni]|uniref:ELM2 domain-containing protein n=1 Tax=Schistosoma curassoni TaxID=6186 RepID=A0A183JV01_9TREM|nr:unnamed protein product [Schistosoma curassoni]
MVAGDQQLVHTPFVPSGSWSPCAPLVWNPVEAPDIRISFSHFRKQHYGHEKVFELAEINGNMLNVPISCVNIVHSSDLENIQTPLNYYELNERDASNDFYDSKQNVDTMTDENLKDTTDSPEVSWEVAEGQYLSLGSFT